MVKVKVLNDKGKKHLHLSQSIIMNLRPTQYTSFMDVIGMNIRVPYKKAKDETHVRSIDL